MRSPWPGSCRISQHSICCSEKLQLAKETKHEQFDRHVGTWPEIIAPTGLARPPTTHCFWSARNLAHGEVGQFGQNGKFAATSRAPENSHNTLMVTWGLHRTEGRYRLASSARMNTINKKVLWVHCSENTRADTFRLIFLAAPDKMSATGEPQ